DWNNPRFLGQQPGERDLGRRRLLPLGDLAEQINQGLIRLPSLRREARDDVAKVGTVECRVFVDLSCQEALTQRAEGNEADAQLLKGWQHFFLGFSPPQRVLDGCSRIRKNSAGTARILAKSATARVP